MSVLYLVHDPFTHRPPHLKDLEALEPAFYNSLLWIQENDPEPLDLTFTVEEVCVKVGYADDICITYVIWPWARIFRIVYDAS